ncbi:MAG: chaperone NapD [Rhodocyclaceae bacterium]|nr:chaperone NapD [Rhodocyclaceae bacterium]
MRIASLVLRAKPEDFDELKRMLRDIPGVEVHGESVESGRMVVTVEDGEGYSVTDSILAINLARPVLSLTLAYEYSDEEPGSTVLQEQEA